MKALLASLALALMFAVGSASATSSDQEYSSDKSNCGHTKWEDT